MKNVRRYFVSAQLALCSMGPLAADAQVSPETVQIYCQDHDDDSIVKTVKVIVDLDTLLPNVPPEELQYMDAEEAGIASLRSLSKQPADDASLRWQQRAAALQARPLYVLRDLRKKLTPLRNAFAKINDSRSFPEIGNEQADRLERAISATTSIPAFVESAQTYLGSVQGRGLAAPVAGRVQFIGVITSYALEQYMQCKLRRLLQTKR
jgi:hypothetical protein